MRLRMLSIVLAGLVLSAGVGCGGDDEKETAASTGGSTSTGAGGGGGGDESIHGCARAVADDHTGKATFTIKFKDFEYTPKCIVVDKGTTVTFSGDFANHPLVPGEFIEGTQNPDPSSPIKETDTGMEASFTLGEVGTYPYYCGFHSSLGMYGVVFVQ